MRGQGLISGIKMHGKTIIFNALNVLSCDLYSYAIAMKHGEVTVDIQPRASL